MCCDACSRQAIVSSMYTVHMLGEGGSLTHTHSDVHVVTHTHKHSHTLSEPKGYKAGAYSKNPPLWQECTVLSSLGEGRKRECMWVVVGGVGKDAGYCEDANLMHLNSLLGHEMRMGFYSDPLLPHI